LCPSRDDGIDDYDQAQKVVQQVKAIFGIGQGDVDPPEQPRLSVAEGPPAAKLLPAVSVKEPEANSEF